MDISQWCLSIANYLLEKNLTSDHFFITHRRVIERNDESCIKYLVHATEKAEDSETLPEKQANNCRSFKWYATEVNHNLLISADASS